MQVHQIQFPGYMERCYGFTVPNNGVFYALDPELSLAQFDVVAGTAEVVKDGELRVFDDLSVFELDGVRHPFVGYAGTHALLSRNDLGDLTLANSKVTLTTLDGSSRDWQFENFSGDWEQVTFDVRRQAFLFGAPYDFDFKYVDFAAD